MMILKKLGGSKRMECCFCKEHNNVCNSAFYYLLGRKIGCCSRVLAESQNWYAIPTLGSLTVGYVLLVCKQHYLSLACMNKNLISEMVHLKENIEKKIYSKLHIRCVAFEHGSTKDVLGANSVNHVHIHIVPLQKKIWNDIVKRNLINNYEKMFDFLELYNIWKMDMPDSYLLFQDLDKRIYYIDDAEKYGSQFFRRCIASYLNIPIWDWKQELYSNNILKTLELFEIISDNN